MIFARGLAGLYGLSARIQALAGWSRYLFALALGAISATAFAPLFMVPFLLPAFCGLLWLLKGAESPRKAALVGWAFGAGYFAVGLYWVGAAFLVNSARHAWIMPFAIVALAVGMGLFHGLVTYLLARSKSRGVEQVVAFVAIWLLVEWLRSWIFTGFPWNLLGAVWTFSDGMLQLASVTGVWGLSVITLLAAAAPAVLFDEKSLNLAELSRRVAFVFIALLLPLVVWGGGVLRLSMAPVGPEAFVPDVTLRLVQPNIKQADKWKPEQRGDHIVQQMGLSAGEGFKEVTHVIWPETAVPFLLSSDKDLRTVISRIVPPGGFLLTGAPRVEEVILPEGEGVERNFKNSIHALDRRGEIVATYDKFHLVPFGEYVPFNFLFRFAKLTVGQSDFTPGPGPRTLILPGLPPVSPLVCYEIIFPGAVVDNENRPDWILNLTNDGWFGITSGPYQHLGMTQLRAVEEGLPVIRVANTGVSASIDAYGRIVESVDLGGRGVVDSGLPVKTPERTVFSRVGNFSIFFLLVALLLPLVIGRWKLQNRN
ncbi:apolipoprotein N-acyltransferase [Kiloniella laminariae]|uniref:Apolipoprotein N-acyltransferase n=1 Tax=Kiloniella laminariae TaxID=454162 RepID=A0ABT4LJM7_9PROT|nr:apolipoprotein N-acyltransferase [Kiloniella laminariae]MCZ4281308.1 apolipoprotein N-acyltransferase [Kiloniella laminariae]